MHICTVYMHMTVCIYALCVCGHALHGGRLEQCYLVCTLQRPSVHLGLEANAPLAGFWWWLAFFRLDDRLLETDKKKPGGLKTVGCNPF